VGEDDMVSIVLVLVVKTGSVEVRKVLVPHDGDGLRFETY
jgi:hypothetical protein